MPYDASPLDLDAEHDRLAEEYHDALERAEDDSRPDGARRQARQEATQAKRHAAAVEHLQEKFGEDAEIVVGGLTMGEDAEVTDRIDAVSATKTHSEAIRGVSRNYTVAAGVEAAPFYDGDASELDLGDRAEAIADLPRHVGKYLHDRIAAKETLDPDLGNGSGGGS